MKKEIEEKIDSIIDCLTDTSGGNSVTESDIRDAISELNELKKLDHKNQKQDVCTHCYGTKKDHSDETMNTDCPSCVSPRTTVSDSVKNLESIIIKKQEHIDRLYEATNVWAELVNERNKTIDKLTQTNESDKLTKGIANSMLMQPFNSKGECKYCQQPNESELSKSLEWYNKNDSELLNWLWKNEYLNAEVVGRLFENDKDELLNAFKTHQQALIKADEIRNEQLKG